LAIKARKILRHGLKTKTRKTSDRLFDTRNTVDQATYDILNKLIEDTLSFPKSTKNKQQYHWQEKPFGQMPEHHLRVCQSFYLCDSTPLWLCNNVAKTTL